VYGVGHVRLLKWGEMCLDIQMGWGGLHREEYTRVLCRYGHDEGAVQECDEQCLHELTPARPVVMVTPAMLLNSGRSYNSKCPPGASRPRGTSRDISGHLGRESLWESRVPRRTLISCIPRRRPDSLSEHTQQNLPQVRMCIRFRNVFLKCSTRLNLAPGVGDGSTATSGTPKRQEKTRIYMVEIT